MEAQFLSLKEICFSVKMMTSIFISLTEKIAGMIKTIKKIKCLGKRQMKRFVSEWLESRHISIDNPIKKKLGLCSGASNSSKSVNTRRKDLQNNVKMFAQLPIATQARGSDFVQS